MHLCSVKGISTLCSPAAGRVQREDPCTLLSGGGGGGGGRKIGGGQGEDVSKASKIKIKQRHTSLTAYQVHEEFDVVKGMSVACQWHTDTKGPMLQNAQYVLRPISSSIPVNNIRKKRTNVFL